MNPRGAARTRVSPALAFALTAPLAATLAAQDLEVTTDAARIAVGEQVTLRVEAHLGSGARLEDRVPRPIDSLPEGVRVVSVDSLTLAAGGSFVGRLRVAFLRPGQTTFPALAVGYHTSARAVTDTAFSRPLPIDVVASLPSGNQPMRDIKDLEPLSPGGILTQRWVVALAAAALVLSYAFSRAVRRRRPAPARGLSPRGSAGLPSPYDVALAELAGVEAARWASRGEVARHYERVADALRRYLEDAHGVRALERTTPELAWALPLSLAAGGLREDCRGLLDEADLVKFARLRPDERQASAFLARARELLGRWYAASETGPATATANAPHNECTADEAHEARSGTGGPLAPDSSARGARR